MHWFEKNFLIQWNFSRFNASFVLYEDNNCIITAKTINALMREKMHQIKKYFLWVWCWVCGAGTPVVTAVQTWIELSEAGSAAKLSCDQIASNQRKVGSAASWAGPVTGPDATADAGAPSVPWGEFVPFCDAQCILQQTLHFFGIKCLIDQTIQTWCFLTRMSQMAHIYQLLTNQTCYKAMLHPITQHRTRYQRKSWYYFRCFTGQFHS